jgi:CBS domain containing-hemolysin-like protein
VASTLAVIVLTYFHIVVGEMVPKALALQHAERTALWITPPILAVKSLLYPLVVGLNELGNLMLRMLGITRQASAEQYCSPDELRLVIEESREGGTLRAASAGMLKELLAFGEFTARQVMVPRVRVIGIPLDTRQDDLRAIVRTSPHSRYPVYEKDLDHIVGIIHIKDALRLMTAGESVQRRHVRPVPIVPDTASLDAVLTAMARQRTQMAVTIDEHGGVAGIVTLDDLFEEVVGEIPETGARLKIHRDSAGTLLVSGETRLDELAEHCGIALEHETVDSVSGLILSLLGRPAAVGEVVESGGLRLTVTAVHGHGVAECAVTQVES